MIVMHNISPEAQEDLAMQIYYTRRHAADYIGR